MNVRDDNLLQVAFAAALRSDFQSFLAKTVETLSPGQTFLNNWHIAAIAAKLERVRVGLCRRLIICLPPRSLKSLMASVAFPAFLLGHDPRLRIICASYGAELSRKHANDCRAILGSRWYKRAFPATAIDPRKNTEAEFVTTQRGGRLSVSVGGPLTGRGGDLIIVDDPLKPLDAISDTTRTSVNQWFINTLISRLDDKQTGAIIIVMQRVHMDDLVGFVTDLSDEWEILSLPAIESADQTIDLGDGETYHRRAGEALHPAREPLSVLEKIRREIGSDNFSAQYQQQPIPPGGAMIKRNWVPHYSILPSGNNIIQSWDTANKGGPDNDWSVCTTWLITDKRYYLVHLHRARHDYPALKAKAIELARLHKAQSILVEDAGTGTALIAELRNMRLPAVAVIPDRDKIARMSAQSGKIEAGLVWLPRSAPWLATLEAELYAFPGVKHDDQVDSISQFLAHHADGGYRLTWEMLA